MAGLNIELGRIEIPIYHNNESVNYDSMEDDFNKLINHIKEDEANIIEAIRD